MLNVANVFHTRFRNILVILSRKRRKKGEWEGEDKWTDKNLLAIISFRDTFTVDSSRPERTKIRSPGIFPTGFPAKPFDPDEKTLISESAPRESETRDFSSNFPIFPDETNFFTPLLHKLEFFVPFFLVIFLFRCTCILSRITLIRTCFYNLISMKSSLRLSYKERERYEMVECMEVSGRGARMVRHSSDTVAKQKECINFTSRPSNHDV